MTRQTLFAILALIALFFVTAGPSLADGIIIPEPIPCIERPPCPDCPRPPIPCPPPPPRPRPIPPLAIKYHRVTVTIEDQVARTHVDQVFLNDAPFDVEGTYLFPLPEEASISQFAMWVDGQKLEGKVLDKDEARRIYESIVRSRRDPALLEYVGRNAFQARVFPIPARGEKRIELEYTQVLRQDAGLVRYVYPLNTEKFSARPLQQVSIQVDVRSREAIKAIYSPSHRVAISRDGEYRARIGYEENNVKPDTDFALYYSISPEDVGLSVLSYKPAGESGFFLLLAAPKVRVEQTEIVAKDVFVILDVSGSMRGEKLAQAKRALEYILDHLNPGDRFNVIAFSTGTRQFASSLQPLERRTDARRFVNDLQAEGSTDINRALLDALRQADPERPQIVIFLTDGLATAGEVQTERILDNVARAAPKTTRLFTFGIGDEVNTTLLDRLAQDHRGASAYVRPTQRIDEEVSAFYAKVSTPVLSDISLDFGNIQVEDTYPYPLPDLFAGSQLVLVGRYREGGGTSVALTGLVNNQPQSLRYDDVTFARDGGADGSAALTTSFIPRLWATRKIGYLLNQIRLKGENREAVEEIVHLATRYGIVTPYTSFLVNEREDVLTQEGRQRAAEKAAPMYAPGAAPNSGAAAVQDSQARGALSSADRAAPVQQADALRQVGDKAFIYRNGVWTDTAFDPSRMQTSKLVFSSQAYFDLLAQHPDWGRYFALSERVIVVLNGKAYETTSDGTSELPPSSQVTATPAPVITTTVPRPTSTTVVASPTSSPATPVAVVTPAQSTAGSTSLPTAAIGMGVLVLVAIALKASGSRSEKSAKHTQASTAVSNFVSSRFVSFVPFAAFVIQIISFNPTHTWQRRAEPGKHLPPLCQQSMRPHQAQVR